MSSTQRPKEMRPASRSTLEEFMTMIPMDVEREEPIELTSFGTVPGYTRGYSQLLATGKKLEAIGAYFGRSGTFAHEAQPSVWFQADLQMVQTQLAALREEIAELRTLLQERPSVASSTLHDLGVEGLEVTVPIPIILEETDDEASARWPEVRASAVGSTLGEAMVSLKAEVADLYWDLNGRDPKILGEIANDTLRTLRAHIRPA